MKLRKVGNSLGATFTKALLTTAGFEVDEELEVVAAPGELRIKSLKNRMTLDLSSEEAMALATGNLTSKPGKSVVTKAKNLLRGKR